MVVAAREQAGARLGLVVAEDRQDAEDDGDAEVELRAHQAVGYGVGDVLEVHRLALDQDADGDDSVKGGRSRSCGGEGRQVCRRGGKEIAGGTAAGRAGLDLGSGEEAEVVLSVRLAQSLSQVWTSQRETSLSP